MTTATRSIHIGGTPDTVFDRIVHPTIEPGMTVRTVHESPEGAGSVYEWTYRLLGIAFHGITVYTQYTPSRLLACRNLGLVGASVVFTVEPEDGGTRLTREMDFKVRIPLIGRWLETLMVKAAEPDAIRTVACPRLVDFLIRRDVERRSG